MPLGRGMAVLSFFLSLPSFSVTVLPPPPPPAFVLLSLDYMDLRNCFSQPIKILQRLMVHSDRELGGLFNLKDKGHGNFKYCVNKIGVLGACYCKVFFPVSVLHESFFGLAVYLFCSSIHLFRLK